MPNLASGIGVDRTLLLGHKATALHAGLQAGTTCMPQGRAEEDRRGICLWLEGGTWLPKAVLSQLTDACLDLEHRDRQRGQNQRDESSGGKLAQKEGGDKEAPDTCWLSRRTWASSVSGSTGDGRRALSAEQGWGCWRDGRCLHTKVGVTEGTWAGGSRLGAGPCDLLAPQKGGLEVSLSLPPLCNSASWERGHGPIWAPETVFTLQPQE